MMHHRYVCVLNLASLGRESQKGIDTNRMESQSFLSQFNEMLINDLLKDLGFTDGMSKIN
jgi:hypothetical protein